MATRKTTPTTKAPAETETKADAPADAQAWDQAAALLIEQLPALAQVMAAHVPALGNKLAGHWLLGETPTDMGRLAETLQAPFPADRIKWKPLKMHPKAKPTSALMAAYVSNRGIQERLDEAFGVGGWQNEYQPGPQGGVLCGISFRVVQPDGRAEWITKWDGADNTKVEPTKGGLSDSQKRAAVELGIGRYLYRIPSQWVKLNDRGKPVKAAELPPEFLPRTASGKINRDGTDVAERARAEGAFHATGTEWCGGSADLWNAERPGVIAKYAAFKKLRGVESYSTHELLTAHLREMAHVMRAKIERGEWPEALDVEPEPDPPADQTAPAEPQPEDYA